MAANATIKVLERALSILDELRKINLPVGVNELAKKCRLHPSTAFRVIKTLEGGGWVYQLSNAKYILGEKINFVTEKDNFYLALKDVAHPIMERLSSQEMQAMTLCVRINEQCVIIDQSRTERLVDLVPPIGTHLPVYASGSGKVLFSEISSFLIEDMLNLIKFKTYTKYTINARNAYLQELKQVRENGYGIDFSESMEGTACLAVPIRNNKREIIASLSFSGFLGITGKDHLLNYLPVLKQASEEISTKLFKFFNENQTVL